MGEHADEQIARDMRAAARRQGAEIDDDDSQVGFYRAQKEARQEERRNQLAAAEDSLAELTRSLGTLGLFWERKSEYHFHIFRLEAGRRTLVAQWWPSSGKTMDGQRKGQRCATGKQLVSWLRAKQGGAR